METNSDEKMNTKKIWDWINSFNPKVLELEKQNADFIIQTKLLNDEKSALLEEIKSMSSETELDKYCKANFKLIPPIAYKQKREIKGNYYSISLQELITPDAYEVRRFFKGFDFDTDNYSIAQKIGKNEANSSHSTVIGYSILQVDNMDKAVGMLKDHPHIKWMDGCEIEVHEALPTPGK